MQTYDVHVHRLCVLCSPNVYAYTPVLRMVMDVGPYDERPSHSLPGYIIVSCSGCLAFTGTSMASGRFV
jgi:hypothetical protein